ncbi:MAG: Gfo/Idh/MocA family oxidoreductase [Ruminococcaceae bacterium]|nr:Gfo/Idh/MocA family oxidoreductase [Oscillospiraceae bacterium]
MEKLKIAIIGVGGISASHIAAYQKNPNVEIYAFCDINEERLKMKGARYGVTRLFTDEDEMLAALPEIDAVSVCVWNCNHAACSIKALNAGKHVLCEKPIAASVKEAEAMLEAAKKNNRLLMVGLCCRFASYTDVVMDNQKNDFFGDIYYAKASYLRRHGNPGGWFCNRSMSAGGPLIDLGVHILDLTRYLMGNPKPVSVYGAAFEKLNNRPGIKRGSTGYVCPDSSAVCDVEDLATALIRYDNGAVLFLESSYALNIKEDLYSIELFGDKGGVKLAPDFDMYTCMNGYMVDVTPAGVKINEDNCFPGEINNFVDCILNGAECIAPAEDGVEILRILMAIYESARTGHEVIL